MRDRLPYLISLSALAVAVLGSTPVGDAALRQVLPLNSVGTGQIKTGAVTTPKLTGGAVTGQKVKTATLLAKHFRAGQLPAGPPGPRGDKGDKGDKGDRGDPGLSAIEVVSGVATIPGNSTGFAAAICPAGKRPIAGGGSSSIFGVYMRSSFPFGTNQWRAAWSNNSINTQTVIAYAVCAIVH